MKWIKYIIVWTFALIVFNSSLYAQEYLNNPVSGFTTYDINIKSKIAIAKQSWKVASDFKYIYMSDILNDECFTSNGRIDKRQLYKNIKEYFDRHINYQDNKRYNIRIFPEYNGNEACKQAVILLRANTDDKKLLINYPKKLYKIVSRQKYPPFVIKAIFPKKFSQTKNIALLDMRNVTVQKLHDAMFETFARYLEEKVKAPHLASSTTAKDSCRKGDFIARIEMGYVGPWGEGMTKYYGSNVDATSYIKIAEMYKKHFKDYTLVAPSFGMRTGTTTNKSLHTFEYYLLTTTYGTLKKRNGQLMGSKEFGLFIDHLGSYDRGDFSLSYNGQKFMLMALQKYRKAPVIGENNGRLVSDSLMFNDIRRWGISFCSVWSLTDVSSIPYTDLNRWRKATLYLGYRFHISTSHTSIKDNGLHVYFHLGNRSYSPLYDDFWLPQIVIRDRNDSILQVIDADKFINLKSVPCLKESFKYEVMVNKTIPLKIVLQKGAKVYFRVIDKCHINENMFLDNEGRTKHGEYLLSSNN